MLRGQEIEFFTGSAEDIVIPLLDADEAAIPDLSGWAGRLQVRYAFDHPTVLAEWGTDGAPNNMILAESAARLVVDAALATASLDWTFRVARWDLRLTAPSGQGSLPNRPIRGIFRVIQGITR